MTQPNEGAPDRPPSSPQPASDAPAVARPPWWRSIGPALITACVVFGPGSLVISSNVGANYGYDLVWLLLLTGVLMATYLTMGARIGVVGGASPCTLLARDVGRPFAALIGLTLCLTCAAFQFSNNIAVALAVGAIAPEAHQGWLQPASVVGLNLVLIIFLFSARQIYRVIERAMKIMVGVVLVCFVFNLIAARPDVLAVLRGFVPSIPEGIEFGIPQRIGGSIEDPLILIASLVGTTFSVAGAFFQGNLVRERNWSVEDYDGSIGDALAGVGVLTLVSMIIMVTAGTVILGKPADNIGTLAITLQPLLGPVAFAVFCVGLFAVAMNPFLINAMIGGTIIADGIGKPARFADLWPRLFTVAVLLIGMVVALMALQTGQRPVNLMIFGQALTVIGNPLMAGTMLWLANRPEVMGQRRNHWPTNLLGGIGFVVVLLLAIRVLWRVILQLS